MHDPATVLDSFEATLRNQIAFVLHTASGCPPGGGPAWDEVLGHFGIQGVGPDRRGPLAASRGLMRGAFPEELEQVMLALSHMAWNTLQGMHAWGLTHDRPELQAKWQALAQRVQVLAAEQRGAYEAELKPKPAVGAGVAAIFANARATAQINPWGHLSYSDRLTLTCPGCGAPQQAALVFDCRFCGNSLFGKP